MTEIQNCLNRPPSSGKCRKVSFLKKQQNGANKV